MNPGIFLIQPNGEFVEMNETPYDDPEAVLQSWLEKYPSLLAGHQIDPDTPRKWLFIERESPVPSEEGGGGRWAADPLFLDQDAIPTIVEVKGNIQKNPPFDIDENWLQLRDRLNRIPGVSFSEAENFPNIILLAIANDNAVEAFLQIIAWSIEQVKAAQQKQNIPVAPQLA